MTIRTAMLWCMMLAMAPVLSAQGKINNVAAQYIDSRLRAPGASRDASAMIGAIVRLAPGGTVEDLRRGGAEIIASRDGMALVRIPAAEAQSLADLPAVRSLSCGQLARPLLNYARQGSTVTAAQQGIDGTVYDGTGVLLGMMDTGLDPRHVNFSTAPFTNIGDQNRILTVWSVEGEDARVTAFTPPYRMFTTDNQEETHATHVAGIMAGAYNGTEGTVATVQGPQTSLDINDYTASVDSGVPNPYYGVAPGARMALAVGDLYDVCILTAAEKFTEYCKSQGKPGAFNISLGSVGGPHDGTDDFSQYLASIGQDVIVSVAAGNDGDMPVSIQKTFTASDRTVRSCFWDKSNKDDDPGGGVEVWVSDGRPVSITFSIVNTKTGASVYDWTVDASMGGDARYLVSSNYALSDPSYFTEAEWSNVYNGYLVMRTNVDPNNGRYTAYLYMSASQKAAGGYVPAISVTGADGQTVDLYTTGNLGFYTNKLSGMTAGNAEQSINGMACGDNVICVGSYQTRFCWPYLSGARGYYGQGGNTSSGHVSYFSSYGTTFSGRELPDVCAPGGMIISSYSTPYVNYIYDKPENSMTALSTAVSRKSWWGYMQGTSMAAPYMTGVAALWLQADPTLTVDDMLSLIKTTSNNNLLGKASRMGAGRLDAYNGLCKILGVTNSAGAVMDNPDARLVVRDLRGELDIFVSGETSMNAALTSMSGIVCRRASAADSRMSMATDGLAPGVYVLTVEGATGRYSRTMTIR